MAETTRAKHGFRVKESASDKPWIMFELLEGEDLPVPGKGFLGFDLKEGTTLREAEDLAAMMNRLATDTSYTQF